MSKKISLEDITGNGMKVEDFMDDTFKTSAKEKTVKKERARVPIEYLEPNKYNNFTVEFDDSLDDLSKVISDDGISNPIRVKQRNEKGKYVILSGHRRWEAAKKAGLSQVEVMIINKDFTPAEEIAYITRENIGGRGDDPFGKALMIKGYNKAQEMLDEEDKVPAMAALRIGQTSYYEFKTIAENFSEDFIKIGQKGFFTKEDALNLCRLIKEHKILGAKAVDDILEIYNSDESDSVKRERIKEIINLKVVKPNKGKSHTEKPINGFNTFKKVNKILLETKTQTFSLPSSEKKRSELREICEEIIKVANECLEKL